MPTSAAAYNAYNTFDSNIARITPVRGLLVEEARTNQLLNSTVPATQTTASLGTGTYTLWVNGDGSATSSAGTATGSGFGAATNGTPNVFTLSGAGTVVVTVAGSLNAFQLEAGTFGTSLIVTAGVTATRAADVVTVTNPPTFGSAYTLFGKGTPNAPSSYSDNQFLLTVDDGSSSNRVNLLRHSASTARALNVSAGVTTTMASAAWTTAQSGRLAVATVSGSQAFVFNGGSIIAGSGVLPAGVSVVRLGVPLAGNAQFNGTVERIALWPNTRLPNGDLQRLTSP
jgi:hypothetical protein